MDSHGAVPKPENSTGSPAGEFDVMIASTGQVIAVSPDQSVLEALEDAGYVVPWVCRAGFCGTCVTRVLDGEVDHLDTAVDPVTDPNAMAVCVSRSKSTRIVLSL
ncbi:2Fe-2S iron-sulfur cluster-binding protein [Rhodococcus sp. 24CO]|uniref:2Fe-2S iron-sulfur cluster-binding protein n=1 Tax=Rhodococcus sp. 24CO TaxID=3117460 RepID=UPI003D34F346